MKIHILKKYCRIKIYLVTLFLLTTTLFAQDVQYTLHDLSSEIGFDAWPTDINNKGQIVGLNRNSLNNAFIWQNGITTIISPNDIAVAINDSGWVLLIGFSALYLWKDGSTIDLDIGSLPAGAELSSEILQFMDVNNHNNVIIPLTFGVDSISVGYLWQNGVWSPLPHVIGFESNVPTQINDNNDISGYYFNSSDGLNHPLYWQNNNVFSFSFEGFASSLNNDLRLVGGFGSFETGNKNFIDDGGWRWNDGIFDTIMTVSTPTDVNAWGRVVGDKGHIHQDGITYSIESVLDSTGDGYDTFGLGDINDLDQIVGVASLNNSIRTILFNPVLLDLEITSPEAGETWIAGEQDTIRWVSSEVDTIDIEFSIDDGSTYEPIESLYPASSGEYIWNIPDTLLSRKCKIRMTASSFPGIDFESELFKIKGYYLTRITPSGEYEKFVPNEDGWKLNNTIRADLWPQQWWQQFDYNGTDPFTHLTYIQEFNGIPDSTFSDWPLYVETFGLIQTYGYSDSSLININSIKKWKAFSGPWKGSCYGLSTSSLLGFNYKTELRGKHPGMPDYINLYELTGNDDIRKVINHYHTHQGSKLSYTNTLNNYQKKPWTTLLELRQMFIDENPDVQTLTLKNQGDGGGGHSVVPYKIEKEEDDPGIYNVYVYDPNFPGSDTSYIAIDSTSNSWVDYLDLNWDGGEKGLFLVQTISTYLPTPDLKSTGKQITSNKVDPLIQFYASYPSNYLMTTVDGDSVGFVEDRIIINLEEGVPLVPDVGGPHPPIGYYIPQKEYSISMSNFNDASAYLTVFGDITYDYQRNDAAQNQTDKFYYNGNFSVSSDDVETKNIELSTVMDSDSSEKTIYLENTTLIQNDSLDLSTQDNDKLTVKNYGSEKSYDLRSIYASNSGGAFFLYENISLAENSSHQIVPVWEDLVNTPIKVLIDIGIDGSVDDSLEISNQITNVKDQGNLYIPREFKLEQNYPNPFNPTTTIRYSLPYSSFVRLKVYDVLGEEVATLVNEEKTIGNYEVKLDASVSRQIASGIYFYRIETGSFTETKKMLLLK